MLLKKYLLKRLMQTKYLVLVFIYYLIEIIIYDELYCIILLLHMDSYKNYSKKKKHKYKSKRHSSIDVFVKRQSDHLHNRRSAVVAQQ